MVRRNERRGNFQHRFLRNWYDSVIDAAAQNAGCSLRYSEDFQHGERFGGVTVRNPLL